METCELKEKAPVLRPKFFQYPQPLLRTQAGRLFICGPHPSSGEWSKGASSSSGSSNVTRNNMNEGLHLKRAVAVI